MFYDIFMELCREQGKDPYAVPPKVGYRSNSVVAQWKEGSTPRGKYLDNLCKYFNVSKQHLLGLDKETPPTPEGEGLDTLDMEALNLLRQLRPENQKQVFDFAQALLKIQESAGGQSQKDF